MIKHYITGDKLNGNYVRWKKKNKEGIIENIFYERNNNTKTIRSKEKRYMSEDEKDKFNVYNLSKCISKTKLKFIDVCTIFNRLQNGERTTTVDRLKNKDHPLSKLLRDVNIGRLEPFKKSKLGKHLWSIFMKNKKGTQSTSAKNTLAKVIMRYVMVYVKGIDNITSCLDLNMMRDMETGADRVDISSKTSQEIINNMGSFLSCVSDSIKDIKLTFHMFYILADVYDHTLDGNMTKMIINKIIRSDVFKQYNDDLMFCEKGNVPSPAKYKEVRDLIANLCNKPKHNYIFDSDFLLDYLNASDYSTSDNCNDVDHKTIITSNMKDLSKYNYVHSKISSCTSNNIVYNKLNYHSIPIEIYKIINDIPKIMEYTK